MTLDKLINDKNYYFSLTANSRKWAPLEPATAKAMPTLAIPLHPRTATSGQEPADHVLVQHRRLPDGHRREVDLPGRRREVREPS